MRLARFLLLLPLLVLTSATGAQTKKPAQPVVVGDAELAAWVDAQVKERMPTAADRAFDKIGWAEDVRSALALARKHGRPVFLFTHDGRMNVGRC